jgi:hypothetical protein
MDTNLTTPLVRDLGAMPSMTPEEFTRVLNNFSDSILNKISKKLDIELKLEDLNDETEEPISTTVEEEFPNVLSLYEYLTNSKILSDHGMEKLDEEGLLDSIATLIELSTQDISEIGLKIIDKRHLINLCTFYLEKGHLPDISLSPSMLQNMENSTINPVKSNLTNDENMSSVKIDGQKIPPFTGEWREWENWYRKSRSILGSNRWLAVAEGDHLITSTWEKEANNSLFWQLHGATSKGQISGQLRKIEPLNGEQYADGRRAWKLILNFFENDRAKHTRINVHDADLRNLVYDGKNGITITGYIDRFEETIEYLERLGEPLTEHRRFETFKDGITDRSYLNFKMLARQCRWSLEKFIEELWVEDLDRERENQIYSVVQRRQTSDKGTQENRYFRVPYEFWKAMSQEQKNTFKFKKGNSAKKEYFEQIEKSIDLNKRHMGYKDKKPAVFDTDVESHDTPFEVKHEVKEESVSAKPRWHRNPEEITQSMTKISNIDNNISKNKADSVYLSEEYCDVLKQRNMKSVYSQEFKELTNDMHEIISRRIQNIQGPYCIIDSGADLTQMGKGFIIIDRQIHSNLVMKGGSECFGSVKMDFATGIGLVESTQGNILIRVNHGITSPEISHTDIETLISPSQLRAAGVYIDELPHSLNGNQCIIINKEIIIPMTYIHGKMIINVRTPTMDELNDLQVYDITPCEKWEPSMEHVIEFDMSNFKDPFINNDEDDIVNQRRRHLQTGIFPEEEIDRWGKALHMSDSHIVKRTLRATTQLAMSEVDYNAPLKHHMKHWFPQFKHKHFSDIVNTDTLVCKRDTPSVRGYRYVQVFIAKRSRLIKVYLMKTRRESIDALSKFFTDVGFPDLLVYDQAGEENSSLWNEECIACKVPTHQSEAYHQHQNSAEGAIRDLKATSMKIFNSSDNAPDKYWCYVIELAAELLNHSASVSLNWRTPMEAAFGHTPDISAFYHFIFYQKIFYATPNLVSFPNNKDKPGRYLGIAWNVGDMLTYYIEPDSRVKQHNKHIVLARSAVTSDNDKNSRATSSRNDIEPTTEVSHSRDIWEARDDDSGYDYIGYCVGNFIIIADDPDPYTKYIRYKYEVSGDSNWF